MLQVWSQIFNQNYCFLQLRNLGFILLIIITSSFEREMHFLKELSLPNLYVYIEKSFSSKTKRLTQIIIQFLKTILLIVPIFIIIDYDLSFKKNSHLVTLNKIIQYVTIFIAKEEQHIRIIFILSTEREIEIHGWLWEDG